MATLRHVMSVKAPAMKVWRRWHELDGLEAAFRGVDSVVWNHDVATVRVSGWMGKSWDVELVRTESVEGRTVAYKARARSVCLSVSLEAAGAETFVTFVFSYDPPAARLGDLVSDWTRYPSRDIEEGLSAFHASMETR